VVGMKPRALHMLGKCSTTELHPSSSIKHLEKNLSLLYYNEVGWMQWLKPVILPTHEARTGRIVVPG
jgi:hypothetical protein